MIFRSKKHSEAQGRRRAMSQVGQTPQAFSYHARRIEQDYNTGRQQPREQDVRRKERLIRYWRARLGVVLALGVIIVCVFNLLLLSGDPKIVPLTDNTSSVLLHSTSTYEHAAQKLFARSVFNANKITVDTASITTQLKREFPELSDVSIVLPIIGHRPIVYVSPSQPALILTTNNHISYVLAENGTTLIEVSKFPASSSLNLPVVTDQSGLTPVPGQRALPSEDITFIRTVNQELTAEHFTPTSFTLPAAAPNELDVSLQGLPYFGKFNIYAGDAKQQAGTFVATAQYLQSKGAAPGQYIDVRVDGRAYYK